MPAHRPRIDRWSTEDIPAHLRGEAYAQLLADTLIPMRVEVPGAVPFDALNEYMNLGAITAHRMTGTAHRAVRTKKEIEQSGCRSLNLLVNRKATWWFDHRNTMTLGPGDMVLSDSVIPFDLAVANYDTLNFHVEEAWLRQWVPDAKFLVGRAIRSDRGWARVLSSYLAKLEPNTIAVSAVPISTLTDQLGALLALTVGEMLEEGRRPTNAERGLLAGIRALIVQRCTEPSLSAEMIARDAGVHVRTLHRVLTRASTTFYNTLFSARIELAVRMLESPLAIRLTSAEIGYRVGFSDPSHFSRVLRRHTGRTPHQLRRSDRGRSADVRSHPLASSPQVLSAFNDGAQGEGGLPVASCVPATPAIRSLLNPFCDRSDDPGGGHITELPGAGTQWSDEPGKGDEGACRLIVNRGTPWALRQRGSATVSAGHAVLVDVRIPHRVDLTTAFDVARMVVPESWLEHWMPHARAYCGMPIWEGSPWGDTLTSFLEQLARESDTGSPQPVSSVSQHVGVLLALYAEAAWGSRPMQCDLSVIRSAIAQRCFDHALTVQSVAASVSISPRTLHRTLAREGTSFGLLLLGARLAMAKRMLEAPLFGRLTTAEIGARAGFADPSHFARAYRRSWGVSPAKARSAIKRV